jgi:hypothetical protein
MAQSRGRFKIFRIGAILLGLFVSLYLLISKRFEKPGAAKDKNIEHHKPATSADDALKYWTADKMRNARPVDLPQVNTLDQGKS